MNNNLIIAIMSLCYLSIVMIKFFTAKNENNAETNIYKYLLISIVFQTISGIVLYYSMLIKNYSVQIFCNTLYMIGMAFWISIFSIYVIRISETNDKKYKLTRNISLFLLILSILCLTIFPRNIIESENKQLYATGPAVISLYIISGIYFIIIGYYMLKNREKLKDKRYIPVLLLILFGITITIIQTIIPELFLFTPAEALIVCIMYFTIENSDVKMINQLEIAKEQADKANDAKTEFLSSMSHEIRTPLNAIVGFTDFIMTSDSLEEVKDNAKNILEASNTLLEIVNGILDISKIEAGKMEIINSKYNAREIYGSIYKLIAPKMKEKGLEFDYYISSDVPETLYGDHANIKKVITEIINNAYKYTDMGYVRYKVNCKNEDEISQLIITIEDSGRGIRQENITKIFNKFERLEQDRNTTIEGTGLGLSLTKQLVALMGGEVIVETAFGAGTKFTIILNQKIETTPVENTQVLDTTLDLTDKAILIVDDNMLNIKVTKKLLERYNATNIEYTTNGYDCIEKIKRGATFDLIFLDDMMPKISGIETFSQLKEIPNFNQPVVIFTANAIAGMRDRYLSQGFTDYLAKPIDRNELIRVCNTILYKGQSQFKKSISSIDTIQPLQQLKNINQIQEIELIEPINQITQVEEIELIEPIEEQQKINISQNSEIYLYKNQVDLNKALEFLGDINMYNMTIKDFLSEVEEKWNNINEYKNINDMKNYSIEVHSLKSDAKYLGFTSLANIAYQHELKSKENDFTFIDEHFNELQIEYSKALEIAKNYNQMIN